MRLTPLLLCYSTDFEPCTQWCCYLRYPDWPGHSGFHVEHSTTNAGRHGKHPKITPAPTSQTSDLMSKLTGCCPLATVLRQQLGVHQVQHLYHTYTHRDSAERDRLHPTRTHRCFRYNHSCGYDRRLRSMQTYTSILGPIDGNLH